MNIDIKLDPRTLDRMQTISLSDKNILMRFLAVAHRLGCDIYPSGSESNKRVLGVGYKQLLDSKALPGNMFVKIKGKSIYLTEGPDEPSTSNLLTGARAMSVLSHVKVGSSNLPLDYSRP